MSDQANDNQINAPAAIALVAGFGVLTLAAAYLWGIPRGADLDAHFRFVQPFYDELASGNWSPGWLAESNNGFGDARFRFYPPLMFYVMSAFRRIAGDWYSAMLLSFTAFSVTGTIGTYLWARQNFSRNAAAIAAAVFALAPYHLAQFYQASLLLEFSVSAFLPFAFLFLERLMTSTRSAIANCLGFSLSFALIVLTHVPTTLIASLSLAIFALLLVDWRRNKKSLLYAAAAVAIGLGLSAPFWLKVATELDWVQAGHKVTSEYYNYRQNFIFSPFSATNLNVWFGSLIAALTVGIFLPALMVARKFLRRSDAVNGKRAALLVALFAFLMTTDLSRPIWRIVPKLGDIQFPFRWLSVVSVVLCPIAGYSLCVFWSKKSRREIAAWQTAVLAVFLAAAGYSFYELAINSEFLSRREFADRIESVRGGPSFSDWLPLGAAGIADIKPMNGPIDAGTREVLTAHVETHHRKFSLAAGEPTDVRIRTYYYPLWRATITTANGTVPAQTNMAADGTLLVVVPAESCELSLDFPAH